MEAGVLALKSGSFSAAEGKFRSALSDAPLNAGLWRDLGMSLLLQDRSTEAISAFSRSYHLRAEADTFVLLTTAYCEVGDKDEIASKLQSAKRYWTDSKALSQLTECYARYGDPLDAVLAYRAAVKRNLEPLDKNLVGLTRAYMSASKTFLARLEKAEDNELYFAAVERARKASAHSADGAVPYLRRMRPELHPEAQIEELANEVNMHPNDAALLYLIGIRCGELAISTFAQVSSQFPDSMDLALLHADILSAQGKIEQAEASLSGLLSKAPEDIALRYKLCMLYYSHQQWEKAYAQFAEIVRVEPRHEPARARASECLLRQGRFQEEREFLRDLAHSKPPPVWVLLDLATAEQNTGDRDDAVRDLKQAVQTDNNLPTAHYRLAQLYLLAGRSADGQRELSEFKALKGRQGAVKPLESPGGSR